MSAFQNDNESRESTRDEVTDDEQEETRDAVAGLLMLSQSSPLLEEESRCSLEYTTWDSKKKRSIIQTCSTPPPSPENETMKELYQELDKLVSRKAIFIQESQKINTLQDKQRAFKEILKKKWEDASIEEQLIDQVRDLQFENKPSSTALDSGETHKNEESLCDGNEASANTEDDQQKHERLKPNNDVRSLL